MESSPPPPRVDTTASSGARGETRIAPSSNSPAASPSANADGERCGANATRRRLLRNSAPFRHTAPSSAPSSRAETMDSYSLVVAGSSAWNRAKYASASKTSTPVGTAPSSRSGRMVSERTTTGKAPRTACEAYHAAARRTGWTSAATAAEDDGSASKGSDRRISRRRAWLTTEVARQWSLGKSLTRPRRSPHSARIARETRASPRACAALASDARSTTSRALGLSRKSRYATSASASGTRQWDASARSGVGGAPGGGTHDAHNAEPQHTSSRRYASST